MITCAAVTPTPGISSSRTTVRTKGLISSSIWLSIAAMSALVSSMRASMVRSRNRWWLVKCPTNASSSSGILTRIRVRASCASALGSDSPAISAASISRPETPKMSLTTALSLIWASSSSFSTRFFSAVRTATKSAR